MRIVFMGTPEFAVPSLDILIKNDFNVVGVITATDKWGGRGNKKLLESAVKKYAVAHNIPVLQPKNLKSKRFLAELDDLKADLQVVVAFRMLPVVVWDMPSLGTVNLHGSLLPKYRGAAPINWAVIKGEAETGLTTFQLKHEIDTGDILYRAKLPIGENETAGELHDRMMVAGSKLMLKTVRAIEDGEAMAQPQDGTLVTKAPKIFHDTCQVDFDKPTLEVHNFIRGLSPYPTAWTTLEGKKFKLFRTEKDMTPPTHTPGTFVSDNKHYLKVATKNGYVKLLEVQLQGRKRMKVKDFLNGYKF